ncbi:MAG: hypothetical protein KatS3mg024_1365 [Armatimonadota bacterium]|nr:MAG: hypothetical protein KatS3mg024_1365 [Armatimonadota bacterium]
MSKFLKRMAVFGLVAVVAVGLATSAGARLGGVLKGAAIVGIVSQFGGQIDSGINKALGGKGAAVNGATKVVPIFSAGRGAYLGAAQVAGPKENVDQVKGVAQFELKLAGFRTEVMVPVNSIDVSKIHRVQDVGVSAIVDVRM